MPAGWLDKTPPPDEIQDQRDRELIAAHWEALGWADRWRNWRKLTKNRLIIPFPHPDHPSFDEREARAHWADLIRAGFAGGPTGGRDE